MSQITNIQIKINIYNTNINIIMKTYKQFIKENLENDEDLSVKDTHRFKTDEEIEEGYSDFKVEEFNFEVRDMSYMYPDGTFEAMVAWQFSPDSEDEEELTDGGYNTSVEDVIYTTNPDENGDYIYKYAINNWYPESVYNKMCDIIEDKLKGKYGHEYERGSIPNKNNTK